MNRVCGQRELHLGALKVTLGMDVLRWKTPEMVRKELWMHLLVHNLVRELMTQAAQHANIEPLQVSFQGALQTLSRFQELLTNVATARWPTLFNTLLVVIGTHRVGNRPNRYEPRAIKRRPKSHDFLTAPRHKARNHAASKRFAAESD